MKFILLLNLISILSLINGINSFCVIRKISLYNENECVLSSDKIGGDVFAEVCDLRSAAFAANRTLSLHTVANGDMRSDKPLDALCDVGLNNRTAWISWSLVESKTLADVTLPNTTFYFGRFFSAKANSSVYCITDAVSKNCVSAAKEIATSNFEVLIEKLAIRYDLHDITNEPWRNITELETVTLGHMSLINVEQHSKYMESAIAFNEVRNTTFSLPNSVISGLAINVFKNKELQFVLDADRLRHEVEPMKLRTIHVVGPASELNVSVLGTWINSLSVFTASLITTYDNYDKQLSLLKATMVESSFVRVHVVDDAPADVEIEAPPSEPETEPETEATEEPTEEAPTEAPTTPATEPAEPAPAPVNDAPRPPVPVYPGFKQYAMIGGIIFFSAVIIAAIDVTRKIIRNKRNKRKKNNALIGKK